MHPIACQVESLVQIGNFAAAEDAILHALGQEPRNPDLIAAQGLVFAYTGREESAIDLLGKATLSPLGRRLAQVLASHLISRQKLSAKTGERDIVAHAFLTKVRMQTNQPIDRVGVDVSAWVDARIPGDLDRCLQSLTGVVDEIVVHAPAASDELKATVNRYGARFAATISPIAECRCDWILRVDPNEEMGPEAIRMIRRAVVRPQFAGFELSVLDNWSLRLIRRAENLDGYPVARIEDTMINRFGEEVGVDDPAANHESPDEALSRCDLTDEMGMGGSENEYERALALFKLGEIDEALAASARCLAIEWPADLDTEVAAERYLLRGKIQVANGDLDAAAEMFELAVQASPDHFEARLEWGRAWERLGKFDAALSVYLSGQESPEIGVACLAGAGRACSRLGLAKRSADLFREAWRRNQSDPSAWMAWVEAATAYGDPVGIIEAFEASGESPTLPAKGFAAWASAYLAVGNPARAAEKLRLGVAQPDATADMYFALAKICEQAGLDSEAAQAYECGLNLEPSNGAAWLAQSKALHRLGLMHGARISCQRALAIDPDCNEARQLLDSICQAA